MKKNKIRIIKRKEIFKKDKKNKRKEIKKIKIIKRKQIKKEKIKEKIEWKVSKFHPKSAQLLWR